MVLRYASVVFVAMLLATVAVLGASAVQPRKAEAAATVPTCAGGTITLADSEKRSLDLHNQARASKGLSRFCVDPALQRAARAHSKEMIDRDYFSHNSYNGETMANRLKRYGYTPRSGRYWTVGENIAFNSLTGTASADKAHSQWMNSTGHRANILNKNFKQIGIGAFYGNYKGSNGTMWTANFGSR
ncbi:hypothetical protein GBA65_18995 [Rubrobacter marinus]|uniref:SCP domain-containing protein n=1 Tax=Rubrobacter marinus TaxID=2653852 RepID=A0A6G8Q194_9ACTN|nr:CAP domain-containing protein [Rubrobacter marinus]QIN80259.1 hypothetical protein GBA65_18995 [Rubrobacter marinus]